MSSFPSAADPGEEFGALKRRIDAAKIGAELAGVVLDVANVVDVHFGTGKFAKTGGTFEDSGCFGGERCNRFLTTDAQIGESLNFAQAPAPCWPSLISATAMKV